MKRPELFKFSQAIVASALLILASGCQKEYSDFGLESRSANSYSSDVAGQWLTLEGDMCWKTAGFTPPVVARAYAYTSLALYESILPGMPENRSLIAQLDQAPVMPKAETGARYFWPASANAAFAEMMRQMFRTAPGVKLTRIDSLEAALNQDFKAQADDDVLNRSIAYGKSVASVIYQWSRSDGGDEGYLKNFPVSYTPPVGDGMWVQTDMNRAMQPFWGNNRPFRKETITQAAMPEPLVFSTDPKSEFYKEVLETYNAVKNATPEHEEIARFWSCDPGTSATPAGHSFSIMTQVLRKKNASLAIAAEAYAKLGVALNDAFICCWKEKYKYNLIRPVTYINRYIDASWKPILNTPPFPEYASGHSVESATSATIMAAMFGDNFSFDDHTNDSKGMKPRHFERFTDFATEAALSRIYGGIHFRRAAMEGIKEGQRIGRIYTSIALK